MLTRDQARSSGTRKRKRAVRSASAVEVKRRGMNWIRVMLRALPRLTYLSLLILSCWLLYYSLNSPHFVVEEVVVSWTRLVDPEQPRQAANARGLNLLTLKSEGIEKSVRSIAAVQDAVISLTLPGRVDIGITERTPLAQWQGGEGSFLVDREGVAFSQKESPSHLPVVVDLDGPALEMGSRVDPGVLTAVRTLQDSLAAQLGTRPSQFFYTRTLGVVVPVGDGLSITFGDASDLDAKLTSLAAIQQHLRATESRAESIDLRFKGRPTYVLAAPPVASGGTRQQ